MNWLKRLWYRCSPRKFQVGDRVYCAYLKTTGYLHGVGGELPYTMVLETDDGYTHLYTPDGRYHTSHKKPDLKLLTR